VAAFQAGVALSEALSFANLGLLLLNLQGNRLGKGVSERERAVVGH
jgi:hypothetical protein